MASFFSLHRPMSVTAVIPPPSSPSTFSSIFTPRVQHKPRAADIIYTLSTAVNTLEKAAAAEAAPPSAPSPQPLSHDTLRAAVTQASASTADAARSTHLDGQPPQGLQIDIEELARNFRPFNPPPAPVPTTSSIPPATVAGASTLATGPRILSMARAFLQPDPSTTDLYTELERIAQAGWTFRARMRQRSRVWADGRAETRREMWKAISVKRQRKLKMKKHKYKKLMRKTRNLRRRLDRL
ncbi:hypothetical protein MMC19_004381 [Ptychographa xylographoides]|nr:hypothetical protein [Ptychographa xylographoides]